MDIKKPNPGQELSCFLMTETKSKDTSNETPFDFVLYEDGILKFFDEHKNILDKFVNGYARHRLNQITKILKRDRYEDKIQLQILYERIEEYKRNEKANKDYFAYLQSNGIDFQFWRTMYETDVLKRKTQKESEKTFKDGLDRMRKLYPDHFKKTFADDDANAY
jgi:hypothetical protein